MVFSASANLAVLVVAALVSGAHAHSYMILPLPTWPVSWATNSPSGTIEGDDYLPLPDGMSYSSSPLENTEAYWTAFNASDYTSLREFVTNDTQVLQSVSSFGTATVACGFSLTNGTARDLPAEVEWEQLTSSHEGPFEIWCDDTLVFKDSNAAVDYTGSPAVFPYEVAKCEGASMLTSYWLALHQLPWQVFTNCAPLTGDYSSSVDASAIDDASATESASTEDEASFTDDYASSAVASGSDSSTVTTSTMSTAASVDSATSAKYSAASENDISSSTSTSSTSSTTATTSAEASTTSDASADTPTSTASDPTAATATPTPTASSSTSGDKCSVRRRRN